MAVYEYKEKFYLGPPGTKVWVRYFSKDDEMRLDNDPSIVIPNVFYIGGNPGNECDLYRTEHVVIPFSDK